MKRADSIAEWTIARIWLSWLLSVGACWASVRYSNSRKDCFVPWSVWSGAGSRVGSCRSGRREEVLVGCALAGRQVEALLPLCRLLSPFLCGDVEAWMR